jgi:hypothetical protein
MIEFHLKQMILLSDLPAPILCLFPMQSIAANKPLHVALVTKKVRGR